MRFGLAPLLLLLTTAPAAAQLPGRTVLVGFGLGFPAGPQRFTDTWGFGVGARVGLEVPVGRWTASLDLDYTRFPLDKLGFLGDAGRILADLRVGNALAIRGGAARVTGALAGLGRSLQVPGGLLRPYGRLLAGVLRLSTGDVVATLFTDPPTEFTFEGGAETAVALGGAAGLALQQGEHVGLFLDARYLVGLTSSGIVAGTRTTFFPVRLGVWLR